MRSVGALVRKAGLLAASGRAAMCTALVGDAGGLRGAAGAPPRLAAIAARVAESASLSCREAITLLEAVGPEGARALHADHPAAYARLAELAADVEFESAGSLFAFSGLAGAAGLLASSAVITNLIMETTRLLLSRSDSPRIKQLILEGARASPDPASEEGSLHKAEGRCGVAASKSKVAALYAKYNFREFYRPFCAQSFAIDRSHELVAHLDRVYTQLCLNEPLSHAGVERTEVWRNFDLNLAQALRLFPLPALLEYLRLFSVRVLPGSSGLQTSKLTFLDSLLSSLQLDALDAALSASWKRVSTPTLLQFFLLMAQRGKPPARLLLELGAIISERQSEIASSWKAIAIALHAVDRLHGGAALFLALEECVLIKLRRTKESELAALFAAPTLMCLARGYSTQRLWSAVGPAFCQKLPFAAHLLVGVSRLHFDCLDGASLRGLAAREEWSRPEAWLPAASPSEFVGVCLLYAHCAEQKMPLPAGFTPCALAYLEQGEALLRSCDAGQKAWLLIVMAAIYRAEAGAAADLRWKRAFDAFLPNFVRAMLRNRESVGAELLFYFVLHLGQLSSDERFNAELRGGFARRAAYHAVASLGPRLSCGEALNLYLMSARTGFPRDPLLADYIKVALLGAAAELDAMEWATVATCEAQSADCDQDFASAALLEASQRLLSGEGAAQPLALFALVEARLGIAEEMAPAGRQLLRERRELVRLRIDELAPYADIIAEGGTAAAHPATAEPPRLFSTRDLWLCMAETRREKRVFGLGCGLLPAFLHLRKKHALASAMETSSGD